MTALGLLDWAPAFMLVIARIGPAMMLLPAVGETTIPSMPRVGFALALTIILLPTVRPLMPAIPDSGVDLALLIAGEVFTGLWFGWMARQAAFVLPMMAQMAASLTGLSSVLQPDPELGPQTTALSRLFEAMAPMLFLVTSLYQLPLLALRGLFEIVPPGKLLPAGDGLLSVIAAVGGAFNLAVQLATPFILVTVIWHVALGMFARLVSRMQIYFVSVPGQVLAGLVTLIVVGESIILGWQDGTKLLFLDLPGAG